MNYQFISVLFSRKLAVSYLVYAFPCKFPAHLEKMVMGCVSFALILGNWKMCKYICTQLASHSQANQTVEVKKTSHVIVSRKNSLRMGTSLALPRAMGSRENFSKNSSSSRIFGGLDQLVECLSCVHEAVYSIPALAKTEVIWFEWIIDNFSHVLFRSFNHHSLFSQHYSQVFMESASAYIITPLYLCFPLFLRQAYSYLQAMCSGASLTLLHVHWFKSHLLTRNEVCVSGEY